MRPASILLVAAGILAATASSSEPGSSGDIPDGIVSAKGLKGFVRASKLPDPKDPVLAAGKAVWAGTCQACHGGNKAIGAPKITSSDDWSPRIAQGLDVLFDHAINGFLGAKYAEMPAKGGNADLSDADVKAAVAFMIWASGGAEPALGYAQDTTNK
ncbi:c-type cytochrome [Pseudoprimorskyibacter insulae]|uniref:Cytochrome c-555 n=1 Tax=Pseudoprimorskyibacter insulae TaxID=1695997 RepID=A0A2R8AQS0_9RHOB|nr:c-type cytochrome [Pseudoprimorskyibacter insulae]SPF78421.1 Cytochrome c-555 [Pseudoprimorskyibacter insulae]